MSELGNKVKKLRILRGISQRKLAKLADLSNDYISKIELGVAQNVGIITLGRIAQALQISVFDLQNEVGNKKNSAKSVRVKTDPLVGMKLDKQTVKFLKYWNSLNLGDKKVVMTMTKKLSSGTKS